MIPPQTHIPCSNGNESPELGAASLVDDSAELPPPTYEEAMILFGDEKLFRVFMEEETNKPSNRYVFCMIAFIDFSKHHFLAPRLEAISAEARIRTAKNHLDTDGRLKYCIL